MANYKKLAQKRIAKLISLINLYNDAYYNNNESKVTDREFDELMHELIELENNHPELRVLDSPTVKPGTDSSSRFPKAKHSYPMLSLYNVYDSDEILKFFGHYSHKMLVAQDKIDGLALSLSYVGGKLVRASTRGDGTIGDDVTINVGYIDGIPQNLLSRLTIEVRGEVYINLRDFIAINQERVGSGMDKFANPRNLASGSLKLLNSYEIKTRKLRFMAYEVIGGKYEKYMSKIFFLQSQKFKVPNTRLAKNVDLKDTIRILTLKKNSYEYEIDGLVFKVNDIRSQEALGSGTKYPKWAVAFKFEQEGVETKLLDVIYGVGRTGVVTPVAILEPVEILGTVVKKATLHNADYLNSLGLSIGSTVLVEKGGEIIPQVVSVKDRGNGVECVFPKVCPVCGSKLVKKDEEVKWFCPDTYNKCTQFTEKLKHFCSKKALDIMGFGDEISRVLVSMGLVNNFEDVLGLTYESMYGKFDGAGKVMVNKLLSSINHCKSKPIDRWLFAFGIPTIGDIASKWVFQKYHTWHALIRAAKEGNIDVPGLGKVASNNLMVWLLDSSNQDMISRLKKMGIPRRVVIEVETGGKLLGSNIVVTGTVKGYSRSEIGVLVNKNGGIFQDSVTKSTTMLICGDNVGNNKIAKANKSGIKVISGVNSIEFIHSLE